MCERVSKRTIFHHVGPWGGIEVIGLSAQVPLPTESSPWSFCVHCYVLILEDDNVELNPKTKERQDNVSREK